MKTRIALICLGSLLVFAASGCGDSTDVSKQANDAYHARKAGGPPPPGAMNPPAGGPVGPYAKTGGIPSGSGAPAGSVPNMPKGPGGK